MSASGTGKLTQARIFMAGHSKWANIQHRKGRQDAKRGKAFTKRSRRSPSPPGWAGATRTSTRACGGRRTRQGREHARRQYQNAMKRGTGELEGVNYEEIRYEGYGINGARGNRRCLTDNKTRTVADVRHAFNKHGGNLGTDGSVAFCSSTAASCCSLPAPTKTS